MLSGHFSTSETQAIADTILRIPIPPLRLRCTDSLLRSLGLELPVDETERGRALGALSAPETLTAGVYAALVRIYGSVARLSRSQVGQGVDDVGDSASSGVSSEGDTTDENSQKSPQESVSAKDYLRWKMLCGKQPYPEPETRRDQATKVCSNAIFLCILCVYL